MRTDQHLQIQEILFITILYSCSPCRVSRKPCTVHEVASPTQ